MVTVLGQDGYKVPPAWTLARKALLLAARMQSLYGAINAPSLLRQLQLGSVVCSPGLRSHDILAVISEKRDGEGRSWMTEDLKG